MIRVETHDVLICDDCGYEEGADGRYHSAMEARAAGFNLGWRFPNRTNANGRRSARSDDVCSECVKLRMGEDA